MMSGAVRIEKAIWHRIGDRVVVISNDGGATHVLNKTAAFIWDICGDGCGIRTLGPLELRYLMSFCIISNKMLL